METTETNVTETLEASDTLENMLVRADEALELVEAAQVAYEKLLAKISTEHGATFQRNGQWYQIRHRKESKQGRPITYLCKLPGAPTEWLSGPRKKHATPTVVTSTPAETAAPVFAAAVANIVPTVGGTVVID